ncbi:DUF6470 family protein [Niallia sp. Krafla_26]|uniref:DUF6470 family protein n=1 Tax=Niallia sp. Krafla_26 TaxID=3064703 RepID=UPI003D18099B
MQIPQIRMQSIPAKIEIHSTPSQQSIRQPKAQQSIQQPQAQMSIRTTPGRLSIDQTKAWESMDIKHIFRRIAETAQKGKSDALSGIARRASEGTEMMRIEYGVNAIVNMAKRKGQLFDFQYNIGFVPPPFSVKVHYQPRKVNIDVQTQKVRHEAVTQKPRIDFQAGDVDIRLEQRNQLKIDVVG